mmetsp:Transcript_110855/g.357835  ORF Transcript_110855/g.357835 Transcript_110855/m.357835 type:complete len:498 (-) Transcript_110855:344-1837(-)
MTFQSRRSFSGSGRNSTKLPTGGTSRSCRSSAVDWGASVGSRGGSTKSRGRRTISSTSRSSSGAPGPWPWPPGAASGRALPEPAAAALLSSSTQALQDLRSATLAARMASFRRPMRRSARTRARHLAPARTKRSITCKRTEKVSLEFSSQCGVAMGLKLLGTATWLWLSTDSTRATSSRMWLSRRRACLLLRASCTFWMASSVSGSSPVARSLRSSFSRSCFSISRKSISKRSSRACRCSSPASSSSSSSSSSEPSVGRWLFEALRRRSSAASRWSLMKETRSFSGSFPAVWFSTKFVAWWSTRVVGTFTPSTVRSCTSAAKIGGRASTGPRFLFSCRLRTRSFTCSCTRCDAVAPSSECAFWSTSCLLRSGAAEPTTVTGTGSKSNCATWNCSSARAVLCRVGLKATVTFVAPSGGMTPANGVTLMSGCASSTAISYSNCRGILQFSGITLVLEVPMGTRPKSTIRGSAMSFAEGYAWTGTMRFSDMSPQNIFTVS